MAASEMTDLWPQVERVLGRVERPSRYIDHEWGSALSRGKQACEGGNGLVGTEEEGEGPQAQESPFRFCMIYPDTYELGQANQAVRILTNAVDRREGLRAERAYLPAPDMIAAMKEEGIPLFSLESCAPVNQFDVVGITLPHELAATNVLTALNLADIPLHASERTHEDPIVIAGGPCVFNPEPYVPFFDAMTIGEGEEATPETLCRIKELKEGGASRADILRAIGDIPGTYVPSLYRPSTEKEAQESGFCVQPLEGAAPLPIVRRVFEGFASSEASEPMIVPYTEVAHDRLNVEILRGCARGCRFCQAGMMYRPVRERSADAIVEGVKRGLAETGYEEVSLTSLSSTDHSQIAEILTRLNDELADTGVRISIPSQRLDAFGVEVAGLVAGKKKGGLTFAPEAGTQRMRDIINKNVTEEDLMGAIDGAMGVGWRRMKLYFMIGLPLERDEDVIGIAELANRAYERMKTAIPPEQRGNLRLGISVALFVPKAQTPFQWDGQISSEEALRRVHLIKHATRYRAITISYHEPKTSFIEAVMSRGGREIAALVEEAWRRGASFDAWTELFDEEAWSQAAEALGIDMQAIVERSFPHGSPLPWSHISSGVSAHYLALERERAERGERTPDCTFQDCTACGVCPSLSVSNELAAQRHGIRSEKERGEEGEAL